MNRIVASYMMAALLGGAMATPAIAQDKDAREEKTDDDTLDKAGDIASQPVRDVGIEKTEIPEVLTDAVKNPYALPGNGKCAAINSERARLNAVLGSDFSANEAENENRIGKIAEASGKMIVNSLIPFRGLVREISGAAPAERRLQAAIGAGLARRGYLHGLANAKKCKLTQ